MPIRLPLSKSQGQGLYYPSPVSSHLPSLVRRKLAQVRARWWNRPRLFTFVSKSALLLSLHYFCYSHWSTPLHHFSSISHIPCCSFASRSSVSLCSQPPCITTTFAIDLRTYRLKQDCYIGPDSIQVGMGDGWKIQVYTGSACVCICL